MLHSAQRAEVITDVRNRVGIHVAQRLSESEALQLSLAASMRDGSDVIGFLMPSHLARLANSKTADIRMLPEEWKCLFGSGSQPVRDGGLGDIVGSPEFEPVVRKIAGSLRTTIMEKEQAKMWERSWTKVLCYVAMHLECPEEKLVSTLGTIIKADNRRIEEMHSEIDDDGPETLLIASCIMALSKCLV